jgi:hypothetical protein
LVLGAAGLPPEQLQGNDKLVWALVIIFVPVIGSLLYFTIGRAQKTPPDESNPR